ncbi:hypothetical protein ACOSQ2_032166 [Xanthoceras sorbifolium]
MVHLKSNPTSNVGTRRHRPVILSLPGVGGSRCPVKPASHRILLSRDHVAPCLRRTHMTQLLAWDGQVSPQPTMDPTQWVEPLFHHLNAPTWVTSSRDQARQFNSCLVLFIWC